MTRAHQAKVQELARALRLADEPASRALGRAGNVLGRLLAAARARLAGGLASVGELDFFRGGAGEPPSGAEVRAALGRPFRRRRIERRKALQRGGRR